MVELRSWFVTRKRLPEDKVFYLTGAVYGHKSPKCTDGTRIHTTRILSITDNGDTLEVCTRNTAYTLSKQNIAVNCDLPNESQRNNLLECFVSYMDDTGNAAAQELWDIIQAKRQRASEKAAALETNMFWLELSSDCGYYFDQAFFKSVSGELCKVHKWVHSGMYQDSVILKECDLKYYTYKENCLEFYDSLYQMLSEDMETPKRLLGYIRNSGSMPIRVSFTWGKQIEIKPGETVPVDPAVLEKYPDSQLLSRDDLYSTTEK